LRTLARLIPEKREPYSPASVTNYGLPYGGKIMSLPYYKLHPSKLAGNYHLNKLPPIDFGIFCKLFLIHAWFHEGKLPDDDEYLASLASIPVTQWKQTKETLLSKGIVLWVDDHLIYADMDCQYRGAVAYSEVRKKARAMRTEKQKQQLEAQLAPVPNVIY
jgi:uncharacterized protein YdaU (DUF1376 family)